jgi:hypothetical protein
MKLSRYLVLWALLLCAAGCAGKAGAGVQADRPSQYLITAEEILQQHFRTAFDLINALRPTWLQGRAQSFSRGSQQSGPVVYLDNQRLGTADNLRQIAAGQIESIRFLTATEATSRYGSNHANGAILVATLRQ